MNYFELVSFARGEWFEKCIYLSRSLEPVIDYMFSSEDVTSPNEAIMILQKMLSEYKLQLTKVKSDFDMREDAYRVVGKIDWIVD